MACEVHRYSNRFADCGRERWTGRIICWLPPNSTMSSLFIWTIFRVLPLPSDKRRFSVFEVSSFDSTILSGKRKSPAFLWTRLFIAIALFHPISIAPFIVSTFPLSSIRRNPLLSTSTLLFFLLWYLFCHPSFLLLPVLRLLLSHRLPSLYGPILWSFASPPCHFAPLLATTFLQSPYHFVFPTSSSLLPSSLSISICSWFAMNRRT